MVEVTKILTKDGTKHVIVDGWYFLFDALNADDSVLRFCCTANGMLFSPLIDHGKFFIGNMDTSDYEISLLEMTYYEEGKFCNIFITHNVAARVFLHGLIARHVKSPASLKVTNLLSNFKAKERY